MPDRRGQRQGRIAALGACVAALALGTAASFAVAQIDATDPGTVPTTQATTDDPIPPTVTGETTATEPPLTGTTPEASLDRQADAPPPNQLGPRQQAEAYADACPAGTASLPTSGMRAARQGAVGGDGGSPLVVVLGLLLAAGAAVFLWRRLRGGRIAQGTPLEVASAAVAVVAGLAGLGAQFVPGLGARDQPPPAARMEVRQVHARVAYGDYVRAVDGARRPRTRFGGRELGNVAWLEVRLDGYGGDDLVLDWAEYNVDTGGALIPRTAESRRLEVASDHETRFEPVWVGYPRTGRFQVQFRLLDRGGEVRAMTRTGPMRGTRYRYRCG